MTGKKLNRIGIKVATIVGTLLMLINHGDIIFFWRN
ncbi:nitrate/nitrite transporter NrtS [Colwellia sp. M166]